MFDFGRANEAQKQAISNIDGPVLISAGPGTGKTFTLVMRIVYLIQEMEIEPNRIFVTTFTEKASKELLTRISNTLMERNIDVDLKEMYVGTFHSLCLRIIKENLEYSTLRKNFSILDSFDQQYLVYQELNKNFRSVQDLDILIGKLPVWNRAEKICKLVNGLTEELIAIEDIATSTDPEIKVLASLKKKYEEILQKHNRLDFSMIQSHCLELLQNNEQVLEKYQEQFQYMMVDEYQDTNHIQEQLIFLLSKNKNICVVGDDDQALYRFRGATIRNILEFTSKFEHTTEIKLVANYRSNPEIISFYNKWMHDTEELQDFTFQWDKYRIDKTIVPSEFNPTTPNATFKVSGVGSAENWHRKVLKTIRDLEPFIQDYNQIAFLFNSVKGNEAKNLADYLEENGIGVYSPRSNMFFEREEVKIVLGIMLLLFPLYGQKLQRDEFQWIGDLKDYYHDCLIEALRFFKNDKRAQPWLKELTLNHAALIRNTDYSFSGLFYQLLQFEYFHKLMDTDLSSGVADQRAVRNLSILSNLLVKFEYNENISVFTKKNIERVPEQFFNNFIRFLRQGGIEEYQDETEYAPSGCVSFMTIHQSKGMEFPVVFVGSMKHRPKNNADDLLEEVYRQYSGRTSYEPEEKTKIFDYWRLFYVAFSRAQDILVLTTEKKDAGSWQSPSKYLWKAYDSLVEYSPSKIDFSVFELNAVKPIDIKPSYAFTSDVTAYERCSLQYKMYRELGFSPVRSGATLFGSLVHQTIEDIHKSVIRGEGDEISTEQVNTWFDANYASLAESQHSYLAEPTKQAARKQVENYMENTKDTWYLIQEAEVEVSLVKENFILHGQIDLLRGEGNTVEIMDFKAEKKPDLYIEHERIEQYKKQLEVYAHLVEEKYGLTVSQMKLYYTGASNENPIISFPKNSDVIEGTINEFTKVVDKIQQKDFKILSTNYKVCSECDVRFYCNRVEGKNN
ncbi:ATP-dependent helicase [Trichococcus pasteurii]|uniref:DNA 3'-5' helicase n=1 Tax=Trichococcus pasteurii TaxID=43064 RepID=A0A1W1IJA3_9LACT|nr:ATP-dependent DNA helicase [Trichococcus pasteurii]SFE93655.1 DNA helicase-2 / ATP-dependent DNA helicase PcrA [Trichococcus pasteurii]SLM53077.1 Hypothetical protein TPAS_2789 [Trichococcus pasteurii]SSB93958.1 Hypothetical protein TPAS_2789 [Trichococcus pasteurii]